MIYAEMEAIHTPRLLLRKLTLEDVPLYYSRLGRSKDVTKYMLFQPHADIRESQLSIEKALGRYAGGKSYRYCIALADTNELIGMIEPLRFDEDRSSCSFAYMLAQEFWGQGYGTEALTALLDFLFEKMDIRLVEADHMAENVGSGCVMRKVGMTYQGTEPGKYEKDGVIHDACQYAITKEQWMLRNKA